MTILVVAIAAMAIAVGCGEDGGASGEGAGGSAEGAPVKTSSLSKEEFISEATAVCRRVQDGLLEKVTGYMERNAGGQPEPVALAEMLKAVLLPTIEREIAGIRRLGAPEGDEERVTAILVAQEEGVDAVKRRRQVASIEQYEEHFAEAGEQLRDYGLPACAHSS